MAREVTVLKYPRCDVCGAEAHYDAATRQGPWAFLCDKHWKSMTYGRLGTGVGQRLLLKEQVQTSAKPMTFGAVLEDKERRD